MELTNIFSSYDLKARIFPSILAAVPLFAFGNAIDFRVELTMKLSLLSLASFAVIAFIANSVRQKGQRIEKRLFQKWDGAPTTRFLRHRDSTFDQHTKVRYQNFLGRAIEKEMPTENREISNPEESDALYESGVRWLRKYTQDKNSYPLVFKENVAYGFSRNLLGLKATGIVIAVAVLIVELILLGLPIFPNLITALKPHCLSIIVSFIALGGWFFLVREDVVKRNADSYARALLEVCESI